MIKRYTPRLLLRDHIPEDFCSHHKLLSDPKVMRYLPEIRTRTPEESLQNLNRAIAAIGAPDRTEYFLRIEDRFTHAHVGEIGFGIKPLLPQGKSACMGYFLRSEFHGQGYAAEAMKELIRFAFEELNVTLITCGCLKENAASERVMQKCGMIQTAQLKGFQLHEGMYKDRVEYALTESLWKQNKER